MSARRPAAATDTTVAGPYRAVGVTYCVRCGAWIREDEPIWRTTTHIWVCQECR